MSALSPARLAAAQTLITLQAEEFSQAGDVLAKQVNQLQLRSDDVRLARALVFGVLRHALTLDYYYAPYLKMLPSKLDPVLQILLRLAGAQKFFLSRVPEYAIVNETVELAKRQFRLKAPQVGFLNAVVRKITAIDTPRELPLGNKAAELSVRYSFPDFLVRLFVEKFGTHKAIAIMEASNAEPPLTIRVNSLQASPANVVEALVAEGFVVQPGLLAPGALQVKVHPEGKSLFESSAFNNGLFYVQDEASQLVAHIVAPRAGEHLLDMCSAPGGKATHMQELSGGRAEITATDLSNERLKLVEDNIERLGTPDVQVLRLDEVVTSSTSFDGVLVDAPCSGMGTVRRNPEIRYRLTSDGLKRQAERQLAVLGQAAPLVRPGGRLVYSTCSMSDVENREVIQAFLRQCPEFEISKPVAQQETAVGVQGLQRDDGFYATWPQYPEMDGFEAVVLLRSR